MVTVLKLGGSVITDKDSPETIDESALDAAAADIGSWAADSRASNLVVIHGGGSFGHFHAESHGVSTSTGTHQATALSEIHAAMTDLNGAVIDALQAAEVAAVPVRPLSGAYRDRERALSLCAGPLTTLLEEGFTPVSHGDIVAHESAGATILSGDELVAAVAETLEADRVGLCSAVPGVLDTDGTVIPRIDSRAEVDGLESSDSTDVTGGMAGKVAVLLELPMEAQIFGPDDLPAFFAGKRPGTTVGGRGT